MRHVVGKGGLVRPLRQSILKAGSKSARFLATLQREGTSHEHKTNPLVVKAIGMGEQSWQGSLVTGARLGRAQPRSV